jgi:hypothetical protein
VRWIGAIAVLGAALGLAACGSSSTQTITRHVTVPATPTTSTTTSSSTSPATSSGGGAPVFFQGVAGTPQVRPRTLELTGDGTLYVSGVQWTSWGDATATGSGNAQYHDCNPNCAQATPHEALVSIRLSGIRVCSGRNYYAGMTLTLSSGRLLDESFVQRSWSPC